MKNSLAIFLLIAFVGLAANEAMSRPLPENDSLLKEFFTSLRFQRNAAVTANGIQLSDYSVEHFFRSEPNTRKWLFESDSVTVQFTYDQDTFQYIFPNDVFLIKGRDKVELTNEMIERLGDLDSVDYKHSKELCETDTISVKYEMLYLLDMQNTATASGEKGDLIRCILERSLTGDNNTVSAVIPRYGYQRDTVEIPVQMLASVFNGELFEVWTADEDEAFLLFIKHEFYSHAHMIYINKEMMPGELIAECYFYIPAGNVKGLFSKVKAKIPAHKVKTGSSTR